MKEKIKEVELQPSWSKLKSFHGKAIVGTDEKGNKYLKSFGFLVVEIIEGQVKIHNEIEKWDSKTTLRHINNFLFENGFETGNKKEIIDLYITKTKELTKTENKQVEEEKLKNKENEKSKKSNNKKIENSKIEKQEEIVEVGA